MRIWAIWAVQTTFPKDEVWFSLLQLLVVIALLATLALLAVPYALALDQKSRVAVVGPGRMRSWMLWTVQTVFPKDEARFGLPQLLLVTALLSTLAVLAVPHVLSLRQKGYVITITAEAGPVQYVGHDLCRPGRGDLRAASDRRYA